jgi:hypothetical protein
MECQADAMYGNPLHPFGGHLWFTFLKDGSGQATSGHYDILLPSETGAIKLKKIIPSKQPECHQQLEKEPPVIQNENVEPIPEPSPMDIGRGEEAQSDPKTAGGDQQGSSPKLKPTLDNLQNVAKIIAINSHWHSLIFSGTKTWELRSTPWKFRGDVGIWSGSRVHGLVTIVGCQLVALKSSTGEWEPFDESENAAESFVLADHNIEKHQVPMENLLLLGKSWTRIYAYTLVNPREFSTSIPVKIKVGAHFVQTMDMDLWREALKQPAAPEKPEESLRVLGMSRKEVFRIMDTDVTLLVKTQKSSPTGAIHLAIFENGTAIIVGKLMVSGFHELRSFKTLRKLVDDGYNHLLDENCKLFEPLRSTTAESKSLFGWTIESKEMIHPPLLWKAESCHHFSCAFPVLYAIPYAIFGVH